ncbi:cyclopropane-fatty-acyl-phospholipid synthase [Pseudoalteromonas sp. BSi20652]|nr:cyclopropane-fatty-acyl-phospholipid synthase [Pseudoalteromonas sp. BSi20652]
MDKVSSLNCEQSTSWLTSTYKKLVIKAFSTIETGQIVLIEGNERIVFGDELSDLKATITVNDKAMYKAFALSGSVGAGEAYILGYWSCDNLTSFIEIFAINEKQLDEFEKNLHSLVISHTASII